MFVLEFSVSKEAFAKHFDNDLQRYNKEVCVIIIYRIMTLVNYVIYFYNWENIIVKKTLVFNICSSIKSAEPVLFKSVIFFMRQYRLACCN